MISAGARLIGTDPMPKPPDLAAVHAAKLSRNSSAHDGHIHLPIQRERSRGAVSQ